MSMEKIIASVPLNSTAARVHGTGRTLAAALTSAALRARADMQARAVPEPPPKVRSPE